MTHLSCVGGSEAAKTVSTSSSVTNTPAYCGALYRHGTGQVLHDKSRIPHQRHVVEWAALSVRMPAQLAGPGT